MVWSPLLRSFLARDAHVVARELLGHVLVHETPDGTLAGRIVETEAYLGPPGVHAHLAKHPDAGGAPWMGEVAEAGDPASHAHRGETPRNRVMFGAPGHAYVYLIYGVHRCVNVSTGTAGRPEAVLIRALEPLEGTDVMMRNRGTSEVTNVASGPGKLTQALGITREHDGHDLLEPPLFLARGDPAGHVASTPRVGVRGGEELPLRFHVEGNPHVSRRR